MQIKPAAQWLPAIAIICLMSLISLKVSADEPKRPAYLLGPEDVIDVTVRNHIELNRVLTIQPDGRVNFPEVGEIEAAGKSPSEFASALQTRLEKTRNSVAVDVTVREFHSRRVRVVGAAVKQQGTFDLHTGWRLLDLIAAAGGLGPKPDRITGRIIRSNAQVIPVNITEAIANPDKAENMAMEPDDLVLLEEQDPILKQAYVMGQVIRSGPVQLDPETTVVALLAQAGGPSSLAALTKAYVTRGSAHIPMNLQPVIEEGKNDPMIARFRILPGDVLFIPEIEERFAVGGAVARPNYYPYPEKRKLTALEAYYGAGGQIQGSDPAKAVIIRTSGGATTSIPVNLEAILKKRDLTANATLEPNDILFIPTRDSKRGVTIQDAFTPFSILSFLGLRLFR